MVVAGRSSFCWLWLRYQTIYLHTRTNTYSRVVCRTTWWWLDCALYVSDRRSMTWRQPWWSMGWRWSMFPSCQRTRNDCHKREFASIINWSACVIRERSCAWEPGWNLDKSPGGMLMQASVWNVKSKLFGMFIQGCVRAVETSCVKCQCR